MREFSLSLVLLLLLLLLLPSSSLSGKTEKLERERVCFGERSAAKAKIMLNELNEWNGMEWNGMEWNLDISKKSR